MFWSRHQVKEECGNAKADWKKESSHCLASIFVKRVCAPITATRRCRTAQRASATCTPQPPQPPPQQPHHHP